LYKVLVVHYFLQREGFCLVHTPILTANDCEGAGEVFAVEVNIHDFLHLVNFT